MELDTCPVCNGTTRVPLDANQTKWKHILVGYDAATDSMPCRNCGGQTMAVCATGKVRLRANGMPCRHEYVGHQVGRCIWTNTCRHCGDHYDIDSSD